MYSPWSHVNLGLHPGPTPQVCLVHFVHTPALKLSTMLLVHLPSADGGEHLLAPAFAALLHTPPSSTHALPFFLSPTATKTQAVAQHSLAVDVDVGQSHRCSWHDASCLCCGACGLCDRDDGADVVDDAPSAAPAPTRCALGAAASSALGGALLALLSLCWMTLFHDKVCGFVAKCGCTWPWAGGWRRCNVHNHTGPRCPWCVASAASPLLNVLSQKSAALAMACVALAQHRYRGVGGQTPQHSERHMLLASLACGATFGAPLPLLVKVTTLSLGNLLVACAPPLFTALCCTGLQNLGVESSPPFDSLFVFCDAF